MTHFTVIGDHAPPGAVSMQRSVKRFWKKHSSRASARMKASALKSGACRGKARFEHPLHALADGQGSLNPQGVNGAKKICGSHAELAA